MRSRFQFARFSRPAATRGLWLRLLAIFAVTASTAGCLQQILFLGYLIGGPPSIEPDFETMTKKSLTDKDVTVAVVCYAPVELQHDFSKVDQEVCRYVANRLNQHKIKVVNPDRVHAWLDKNADWDKPEEIGAAFKTTYVIYIDLEKYSLYEENSANLYRGRAELQVSVWEMQDDDSAEKIYTKELTSRYPLAVPRSTSEITYYRFKRQYLSRLSEEIGRLFYESYNGADIPDAT